MENKSEEYLIAHADSIYWDDFFYDSAELSKEFGDMFRNEIKFWYKDGNCHREDGPAFISADGSKYWYKDGKSHREDGPAVIYADGSESWCLNGKLHREDGPAFIYADGTKEWYVNGKLVDGK